MSGPSSPLHEALTRQQARDLLGRDSIDDLIAHGLGFAAAAGGPPPDRVVDLGSGGGVPGLVLACGPWTASDIVLVDASQRRCTYLEVEVAALDLGGRVSVRWGRTEELGHDPALRGSADVVTARSFGAPAVTAEAGAPFLRVGGVMVVSEPPGSQGDRWPAQGLERLGLALDEVVTSGGATYARFRQVASCPAELPRRPGIPERRPLF